MSGLYALALQAARCADARGNVAQSGAPVEQTTLSAAVSLLSQVDDRLDAVLDAAEVRQRVYVYALCGKEKRETEREIPCLL
jgi:hypothetical protein